MEVYPELTAKPAVKRFNHTTLVDPVHRATFGSGSILTRTHFTDVPIKYTVRYAQMGIVDKRILEPWERDNIGHGGERFEWTDKWSDAENERTYVTILVKPIEYQTLPRSKGNYWIVDLTLAILYEVEG